MTTETEKLILAELTALRAEVAALKPCALRRRAADDSLTATEAAKMLGCGRSTFHRRHAPRLTRNRITGRYSRQAVERELAALRS